MEGINIKSKRNRKRIIIFLFTRGNYAKSKYIAKKLRKIGAIKIAVGGTLATELGV